MVLSKEAALNEKNFMSIFNINPYVHFYWFLRNKSAHWTQNSH
jgi:hypothetical protein